MLRGRYDFLLPLKTKQWSIDQLSLYDNALSNKNVCDFIHQGNNLDCSVTPYVGWFINLKEGKYKIAYPYDSQIVSCFVLAVKEYFLLYHEYTKIL